MDWGIIIAACAFIGLLWQLYNKMILDKDLDLEVVSGPQSNFKDEVGFVIKNIGGNVFKVSVEPGSTVQIRLLEIGSPVYGQKASLQHWPSGHHVRMVATHRPTPGRQVGIPTNFTFYISCVHASGLRRWLTFQYFSGVVTRSDREFMRLRHLKRIGRAV